MPAQHEDSAPRRSTRRIVVEPRSYGGFAATLMFWKGGPMFAVGCGNCPATFRQRIPMTDCPTLRCPDCGAYNQLPLRVGHGL